MTRLAIKSTRSAPLDGRVDSFANFDVVVQSWYVACRSKHLRAGKAKSIALFNRRVALWRDESGVAHALDARCPHLGADLGQGSVCGNRLRCAFHHWTFDVDGECVAAPQHAMAPKRRTPSYPVLERFGLVWVFAGPAPTFDLPPLPDGDDERQFWRVIPPTQHIQCHPHLVIGNGLDTAHFSSLHRIHQSSEPRLERNGPHKLTLYLQGRPSSEWLSTMIGVRRRDMQAKFAVTAGSLAWLTVEAPLRFHVLFTGRASEHRGCDTQTVLFLPRGVGLGAARAILLLYCFLHSDRQVLDRLQFHPSYSAEDDALRQLADMVNEMDVV